MCCVGRVLIPHTFSLQRVEEENPSSCVFKAGRASVWGQRSGSCKQLFCKLSNDFCVGCVPLYAFAHLFKLQLLNDENVTCARAQLLLKCSSCSRWRTRSWSTGTFRTFWGKSMTTLRWLCTRSVFLNISCRRMRTERRFSSSPQSESIFHFGINPPKSLCFMKFCLWMFFFFPRYVKTTWSVTF